ncbi:hypothetical protein MMC34_008139, partial [Xylographa carneopallida]|nr:hypothetical protein [Xylographa carneopallida]
QGRCERCRCRERAGGGVGRLGRPCRRRLGRDLGAGAARGERGPERPGGGGSGPGRPSRGGGAGRRHAPGRGAAGRQDAGRRAGAVRGNVVGADRGRKAASRRLGGRGGGSVRGSRGDRVPAAPARPRPAARRTQPRAARCRGGVPCNGRACGWSV